MSLDTSVLNIPSLSLDTVALKKLLENCKKINCEYVKKHNELKEVIENYKRLAEEAKSLDLFNRNLISMLNSNNFMNDDKLQKMKQEQSQIMGEFRELKNKLQNEEIIHKQVPEPTPVLVEQKPEPKQESNPEHIVNMPKPEPTPELVEQKPEPNPELKSDIEKITSDKDIRKLTDIVLHYKIVNIGRILDNKKITLVKSIFDELNIIDYIRASLDLPFDNENNHFGEIYYDDIEYASIVISFSYKDRCVDVDVHKIPSSFKLESLTKNVVIHLEEETEYRELVNCDSINELEKSIQPEIPFMEDEIDTIHDEEIKSSDKERKYTKRYCMESDDYQGVTRCSRYSKRKLIKSPNKMKKIVSKKIRKPKQNELDDTENMEKCEDNQRVYTKRKCLEWKIVNGKKICARYSKRKLICPKKTEEISTSIDTAIHAEKDVNENKKKQDVKSNKQITSQQKNIVKPDEVKEVSKPRLGFFQFLKDYVF